MNYTGTRSGEADPDRTFMPTGQGAGLIKQIKPAAEVFADLVRETEAAFRVAAALMTDRSAMQHSAAPPR
jgi:NAD(P)H-dependent flavin oxidoreductase YrpB (nitropropane dioxygenase family)